MSVAVSPPQVTVTDTVKGEWRCLQLLSSQFQNSPVVSRWSTRRSSCFLPGGIETADFPSLGGEAPQRLPETTPSYRPPTPTHPGPTAPGTKEGSLISTVTLLSGSSWGLLPYADGEEHSADCPGADLTILSCVEDHIKKAILVY